MTVVEIVSGALSLLVGSGFIVWATRHASLHALLEERLTVEIARRIKHDADSKLARAEERIERAEELSEFKRQNAQQHEKITQILAGLRDSLRDLFQELDLRKPKGPNGDS